MNFSPLLKSLFLIILASLSTNLYSQDKQEHNHEHEHLTELGMANSLVYFVNEEEFAYGIHFHAVRSIPHTKFGIGLGYERIFDEHKHNTIGVVGAYNPNNNLHLAVSPGIAFEGTEISNPRFALHLESVYDFQLGNIHLGPLLEFAYDGEGYHISLGIHLGLGL